MRTALLVSEQYLMPVTFSYNCSYFIVTAVTCYANKQLYGGIILLTPFINHEPVHMQQVLQKMYSVEENKTKRSSKSVPGLNLMLLVSLKIKHLFIYLNYFSVHKIIDLFQIIDFFFKTTVKAHHKKRIIYFGEFFPIKCFYFLILFLIFAGDLQIITAIY